MWVLVSCVMCVGAGVMSEGVGAGVMSEVGGCWCHE